MYQNLTQFGSNISNGEKNYGGASVQKRSALSDIPTTKYAHILFAVRLSFGAFERVLVNILPVRIHVCKLHLVEFCEQGVVLECGSTSDQRSL